MDEEAGLEEVRAFIAEHIQSVVQLEVLLLLANRPRESWTPASVARALQIDTAWVERQLDNLAARGFLTRATHPEPDYHYNPQAPGLQKAVARLAQVYNERRVTVISMIYSKPADALRAFTDAFRIRKEGRDG